MRVALVWTCMHAREQIFLRWTLLFVLGNESSKLTANDSRRNNWKPELYDTYHFFPVLQIEVSKLDRKTLWQKGQTQTLSSFMVFDKNRILRWDFIWEENGRKAEVKRQKKMGGKRKELQNTFRGSSISQCKWDDNNAVKMISDYCIHCDGTTLWWHPNLKC